MSVDVSIIICTRDRKDHLARTLESLQELSVHSPFTYEIIIVDNGSSDGTRRVVHDFMKAGPELWKYRFEPEKGLSNARNCGVKNARGKIIAFTDDDVIVDEGWLQSLWETFEARSDSIAVQGKILLQEEIKQMPPWADPNDLLFCTCYDLGAEAKYTDMLVGANMALRKEAFDKYGPFDPRLGAGASGLAEETEFCMRLNENGEKIFYQPAALVFHEYDEKRFTWKYWCKRWYQTAQSHAIIDVQVKNKRINKLRNWIKLTRYIFKYVVYCASHNQRKKYKYDTRIRFIWSYMRFTAKLKEK